MAKYDNELISMEAFGADARPSIEVGVSKKTGKPLKVVFKNNVPHLQIFRLNRGQPELCVMEAPFEYARVKQRDDSDYHEKFAYVTQAKLEFYPDTVKISEEVLDDFTCLVFTRADGTIKHHIMQSYRKDDEIYQTVSKDAWDC